MEQNLQLFLDKFVAANKVTYKDQPEVLALLEGLTLADLEFDDIELAPELGDAGRETSFSCPSRKFDAQSQQWLCATLQGEGVLAVTPEVAADLDAVVATGVVGLHLYKDGTSTLAAVLADRTADVTTLPDTIRGEIKAAVGYELVDADFVIPALVVDTVAEGEIMSHCIHDVFKIVWTAAPAPAATQQTEETQPTTETISQGTQPPAQNTSGDSSASGTATTEETK